MLFGLFKVRLIFMGLSSWENHIHIFVHLQWTWMRPGLESDLGPIKSKFPIPFRVLVSK